jgi:hyperosmotically inducible protein
MSNKNLVNMLGEMKKMKVLRYFLILSIAIFGALNVNAQTYSDRAAEKSIEQKAFRKILALPNYGVFDNIAFKVEGGTVTLYGKVLSLGTKSQAARAVKDIEGVQSVVNNIQNLPPSPFDDQIRYQIVRSFANSAGLYGYLQEPRPSVRIIVENGHVTLEGYVNNKGTSNLMNIIANSVPNVFSVTNNLVLDKGGDR